MVITILGLLCIAFPADATEAMLMVLAILVAIGGLFLLTFAFLNPSRLFRNWFFLEGVVDLLMAGLILFYPNQTAKVLAITFGVWLLASSLFQIKMARRRRRLHSEWKMPMANGLLTLLMSLAFIIYPISGVLLFGYLLGITTAAYGFFLIINSFRWWKQEGRKIVID